LSRRVLCQAALLALAGAGLALLPGTPEVVLDPGLALALFVAPVLLDAAFDASPRALLRVVGDRSAAEDPVKEVFWLLWERRPAYGAGVRGGRRSQSAG